MSNNIDNLLSDIYSSDSQSQGVKELANLINNLSNLLLKAISQLETRVAKLEQQAGGMPRSKQPPAPTRAPQPKTSSPFGAPKAPVRTPPPPPQKQARSTPSPAPKSTGGPSSVAEAASMLGATLKPTPKKETAPATSSGPSNASGPSFLTGTVSNTETGGNAGTTPGGESQPDAMAPAPSEGGGIAGPAGGFKGELAEKLARRRQKVQKQLEDDFEAPDLSTIPAEEQQIPETEDSTSSELKGDLESELKNAFSKLKG